MKPLTTCTARVTIQENVYIIQSIVLASCSHDIILGWDFLSRYHAIIRCSRAEVELFSFDDTAIPEPTPKLIVTDDNDILPSNSVLVSVSCDCWSDATVFFTPSAPFSAQKCLPLPFLVLEIRSGLGAILVLHPSSCPAKLVRNECVGHVEPFDDRLIIDVSENAASLHLAAIGPSMNSDYNVLLRSLDDALAPAQREELLADIHRFRDSCGAQRVKLGRESSVSEHIDTGSHAPLRQRSYHVSPTERQIIGEHVADMLKRDVVRPSTSSWASPAVVSPHNHRHRNSTNQSCPCEDHPH